MRPAASHFARRIGAGPGVSSGTEFRDRGLTLEFRMDGAFFRRDVLELLDSAGAEYAIKVPFYPWLHLKSAVAQASEWIRIDDTVSFCETRTLVAPWNQVRRIVLYRKRLRALCRGLDRAHQPHAEPVSRRQRSRLPQRRFRSIARGL